MNVLNRKLMTTLGKYKFTQAQKSFTQTGDLSGRNAQLILRRLELTNQKLRCE